MKRPVRSAAAWESAVEQQIREAMERGEFDNLPGNGKPLPGLEGSHDEEWWVKRKLQREQLSLLPSALALRKEVAERLVLHAASARIERLVGEAPDVEWVSDLHSVGQLMRVTGLVDGRFHLRASLVGQGFHRSSRIYSAAESWAGVVLVPLSSHPAARSRTDALRSKARPGNPSRQALRERPDRDLATLREHPQRQ